MAVFFYNFSELFGTDEEFKCLECFKDYYVRIESLGPKKISYKILDKGDDTGEEVPFFVEFSVGEHRIRLESIERLLEFDGSNSFDYDRIFYLADRYNKVIKDFSHTKGGK